MLYLQHLTAYDSLKLVAPYALIQEKGNCEFLTYLCASYGNDLFLSPYGIDDRT